MAPRRRWSFFMTALEHPPILWFDDLLNGRLTLVGQLLFWGVLMALTLQLGGVTPPLLRLACLPIALVAVSLVVGWWSRPRLRLTRLTGEWPEAGGLYRYRVRVENRGWRAACAVQVQERGLPPELRPAGSPALIDRLEPGETTVVELALHCQRRGAYDLRFLQGASTLPLGLVKSGRRQAVPGRLLVCPRPVATPLPELRLARLHQPGGSGPTSRSGDSAQFGSTRDWRPGDRIRDIHWPSSARAGRLIAREYEDEFQSRVAIVIDLQSRSQRQDLRLEQALAMVADWVEHYLWQQVQVDLPAVGERCEPLEVPAGEPGMRVAREFLAGLETADRLRSEPLGVWFDEMGARLSAVVLVLLTWNETWRGVVEECRGRGLLVRVVCLDTRARCEGLSTEELCGAGR